MHTCEYHYPNGERCGQTAKVSILWTGPEPSQFCTHHAIQVVIHDPSWQVVRGKVKGA